MKKYLILGGTGPIGNGVINLLSLMEDVVVYVTSRQTICSTKENVVFIKGNAHEMSFIVPLLKSYMWDAVIDCMIYPFFEFEAKMDMFLTNTKQYIYISSATVYADSESPITEDAAKLVDVCTDEAFVYSDIYPITKARQEKLLQKSKLQNWTIVRPYITYGDNRLQLGCMEKEYWLYGAIHHRPIVFAKDVADKYVTMTSCKDVGKSIVSLLGHPSSFGTDFNIVGNYSIKWYDVLNIYLDAIEKNAGYRPEVYMTQNYEQYQGGGRYEDYKYDRLYNRIFDNSKLAEIVDASNFITPQEGLANCVSTFLRNPIFKSINFKSEIRKAQVTHCWPSLNEFNGPKTKLFVMLLKHHLIPISL